MAPELQELNAVLERLSRLEKQNRRLKWMGVTALAAASAIFLTGQAEPAPRTVEAQKFVLKDAQGNVRGWMSTIGKGSELTLEDVNAQPMIRLIVSTDTSDVHLFGGPKSGLDLSMDSGNPDISMMGAEGNGEARIAFGEHGRASLFRMQRDSRRLWGRRPPKKRRVANPEFPAHPSFCWTKTKRGTANAPPWHLSCSLMCIFQKSLSASPAYWCWRIDAKS